MKNLMEINLKNLNHKSIREISQPLYFRSTHFIKDSGSQSNSAIISAILLNLPVKINPRANDSISIFLSEFQIHR